MKMISRNWDHRRQRLYQMEECAMRPSTRSRPRFGAPSDILIGARLAGVRFNFLPRHGRGHRILHTKLNHRANIYALRSLKRPLDHFGGSGGQLAGKIMRPAMYCCLRSFTIAQAGAQPDGSSAKYCCAYRVC